MSLFGVQGVRWWERGEDTYRLGRLVPMHDREIAVVREQVAAVESVLVAAPPAQLPGRHAVLVFTSGQRLEVDATPEAAASIFR